MNHMWVTLIQNSEANGGGIGAIYNDGQNELQVPRVNHPLGALLLCPSLVPRQGYYPSIDTQYELAKSLASKPQMTALLKEFSGPSMVATIGLDSSLSEACSAPKPAKQPFREHAVAGDSTIDATRTPATSGGSDGRVYNADGNTLIVSHHGKERIGQLSCSNVSPVILSREDMATLIEAMEVFAKAPTSIAPLTATCDRAERARPPASRSSF